MRTPLPKMIGSTLCVLIFAAGATACADGGASNAESGGATVERHTAPAVDVDAFNPADAPFYETLRFDGALLKAPPRDVRAAAQQATAVVVAGVADVSLARVIGDLQTVGIRLDVTEILHGQLRPDLAGEVVVEHPLGEPARAQQDITTLRTALPVGQAVWFLRWQGEKSPVTKPGVVVGSDPADPRLYGLLHMHALFVQGPKGVLNPLSEHDEGSRPLPGLQADGERFARLSQLTEHIRGL
jgi:hypothetical protein